MTLRNIQIWMQEINNTVSPFSYIYRPLTNIFHKKIRWTFHGILWLNWHSYLLSLSLHQVRNHAFHVLTVSQTNESCKSLYSFITLLWSIVIFYSKNLPWNILHATYNVTLMLMCVVSWCRYVHEIGGKRTHCALELW